MSLFVCPKTPQVSHQVFPLVILFNVLLTSAVGTQGTNWSKDQLEHKQDEEQMNQQGRGKRKGRNEMQVQTTREMNNRK